MRLAALFLVALPWVAACGGGPVVGQMHVEAPLADVARAHKALVVVGTSANGDWLPEARAMATRIAPKLEGLGYFSAVFDEAHASQTQTDLELRITVTELVRVNARERQGRGDGAGQTKIVTTMRLVDRTNGAELGRASVQAAGYTGPHGGTTEDAEDEIARLVVELVSGRRAGG